jgi:tetratricopeptide (TPR) repeat protein
MKPVVGECPDLETLAAYLDNRLSDRQRARVTTHLSVCEDCYGVFSESAQTRVGAETAGWQTRPDWRRWLSGPRLAWSSAGAALATAAAVWLVVGAGPILSSRAANRELQALVAAVGTERPIEARLSGGFAYGPLRGPVRTGTASTQTASADVRIAVARSEKVLAAHRSAQTLHVFGVASVIVGEIDRAIALLEQAADQPSPDAATVSDLAATYLARAARDSSHQDLMKALTAADRAVMIDPARPEALFNRALALERLSLAGETREAWADYLRIDDHSSWANEARSHLTGPRPVR